jgi:regulatory protein
LDADEVSATITDLTERGLVDDRRTAAAHVRASSRVKGRGPLRIRAELAARGIDADTASDAVGEISAEDVDEAIARFLRRHHPSRPIPRDVRDKLAARLLRRGFPAAAVMRALKS